MGRNILYSRIPYRDHLLYLGKNPIKVDDIEETVKKLVDAPVLLADVVIGKIIEAELTIDRDAVRIAIEITEKKLVL